MTKERNFTLSFKKHSLLVFCKENKDIMQYDKLDATVQSGLIVRG
jgi:hypothetical protein